jgi:hypothetical protein
VSCASELGSGESIATHETGADEVRRKLHNDILRSMESSGAISYVNMELVSDFQKLFAPPSSALDVMIVVIGCLKSQTPTVHRHG